MDWTGRDPALEKSPGAAVYRETCAACHDAGADRAPQRANLGDYDTRSDPARADRWRDEPQGEALTAEQRGQVAEYITGRKLGAATAEGALKMCTGNAARFDLAEAPAFTGWGLDPASTHAIPAAVSAASIAANARQAQAQMGLRRAGLAADALAARQWRRARSSSATRTARSMRSTGRAAACAGPFPAMAEVRTGIVVSPWRAGDASARPTVFFGDVMGNVYAVDMLDGRSSGR